MATRYGALACAFSVVFFTCGVAAAEPPRPRHGTSGASPNACCPLPATTRIPGIDCTLYKRGTNVSVEVIGIGADCARFSRAWSSAVAFWSQRDASPTPELRRKICELVKRDYEVIVRDVGGADANPICGALVRQGWREL